MMNELCYIALGSNLNTPRAQLIAARRALGELPDTQLVAASGLYASQPMGPKDQPDYLNAVVCLKTTLTPLTLLDKTQQIEHEHGRVRKSERWGPRTLDLDILLYQGQSIVTERLTIPHYGLKQREFVLIPLAQIAPQLILPDGESIAQLAKDIPLNGLYQRETAELWA